MLDLLEILKASGNDASVIVTDAWEESLHLEFKTVAETSGKLTKEDKKTIAKAICGLANADGGCVIIGVKTAKQNDVDVAVALSPISDLSKFVQRLTAALPDMIQPRTALIDVHPFEVNTDVGIVVINVRADEQRPYMSIPASQFFRRTFDSTRVMDRSEIRDLFLASRDAVLNAVLVALPGASTGDHYFWYTLAISLQNVGTVLARAPYVTTERGSKFTNAQEGIHDRRTKNGKTGFYSPPDSILHLDDEMLFAAMKFGVRLLHTDGLTREALIRRVLNNRDENLFELNRGDGPHYVGAPDLPNETIRYGAANSLPQEKKVRLSKWHIFELVAKSFGIEE
jgi:hypothetical protein